MENQDFKTGNLHEGEGDAMDVGEGGHCSPHVSKLGCVLINLGVCFDVRKQLNHHCSCHESKFSQTIGKAEKQGLISLALFPLDFFQQGAPDCTSAQIETAEVFRFSNCLS